jgi:Holliday junction resolvase RusA-like endonuclease
MIEFTVPGVPQPQGSKTRGRHGGVYEDNPQTLNWRNAVTAAGAAAMSGDAVLDRPVAVDAVFSFIRPRVHYRTGRFSTMLRDAAPPYPSTKPDLDKLCRTVADALTGVVIRDDCRIVQWHAVKVYGPRAQAHITVSEFL